MTFVGRAGYVLTPATVFEAAPLLRMSLCGTPLRGWRHRQRDRLSGLDDHMHVAAVGPGPVNAPRVIVSRIELHDFVAGAYPVEGSRRKLGLRGDHKSVGQHC